MHEHSQPLTTNLRGALWSLRSEKEAGQTSALFLLCSADWSAGMDGVYEVYPQLNKRVSQRI